MENAVLQSPPDWRELTQEDRAVFERVWRRVMPSPGPDSPISLEGLPPLGGDVPCILACPVSVPAPAPAAPQGRQKGPDGVMEGLVRSALELWQLYRALARRGGKAAPLSALAAQTHQAARQLSAACFLRSGVRYWPARALGAPRVLSWEGGLRLAYQQERRQQREYRRAAEAAADAALRALCEELADGCERRCRAIWALLARSGL